MWARMDDNHLRQETPVNALPAKLSALAAALAVNGIIMTGLVYLFALQAHPNMSGLLI